MTSSQPRTEAAPRNKSKPWSRESPEGPWDTLVIGSGMGGMVAAALLTRLGHRVLVLEQHYVPGGFTHTFPRKGYVWDIGVHAVGEVTERAFPGRALADLTDGQLQWASLGSVYEEFYFPDGFRIDFPDDPRRLQANLLEAFPSDRKALDGWFQLVFKASEAMRDHYLSRAMPEIRARRLAQSARPYLRHTVDDALDTLTKNPKLRNVLTAQWGYYGVPPSRAAFVAQALITTHYLRGGYYPVGGSGAIARGLLQTVANGGGWTRILADVEEILIDQGQAIGVRLRNGEELRAKTVLSAIGARATVERLLPSMADGAWARELRRLTPGPAHACLYLGLRGDPRTVGASGANKWFYADWGFTDTEWRLDPDSQAPSSPPPALYCSFPSLKDPEHDPGPEQRHTAEAVTFMSWDDFKPWLGTAWKKRDGSYHELKERLTERLLDTFTKHVPGLREMVDYVELSTPLSTDHFCRPMAGSIYGLEPTPERFTAACLKPRSPVPGLFFAGSDVALGGIGGALMGGVLAAVALAPDAALGWMQRMR